jgi:hypothetical protein
MFHDCTGRFGLKGARSGFTDCDSFGRGLVACDTWTGCLDAPDYYPQGSVRVNNTIKHSPNLSLANRDAIAGCADIGVGHDDASAPTIRNGFAA